ncbi:MAG TPA: hypothetical protein VKR80_09635 [Candidatus Limnocylindria bacterium]|nr:hypothetical protein [Candidatus Limnocylindria bacterium]
MRLPFFRSRPRSTQMVALHMGAAVPRTPAPPPQPRELIDVIGVGATETADGVALTLLSLERYREGLIALFRLRRPRGRFEREFPSPRLVMTVTPEGTVPYRFLMGGGGGGGMRELEFRQAYTIVPAPPTDAAEIVIQVSEISWERWDAGETRVVSVDPGPWSFSVGVPPVA